MGPWHPEQPLLTGMEKCQGGARVGRGGVLGDGVINGHGGSLLPPSPEANLELRNRERHPRLWPSGTQSLTCPSHSLEDTKGQADPWGTHNHGGHCARCRAGRPRAPAALHQGSPSCPHSGTAHSAAAYEPLGHPVQGRHPRPGGQGMVSPSCRLPGPR